MHNTRESYRYWKDFIEGKALPPNVLPEYVVRAWQLSAAQHIDPIKPSAPEILTKHELQEVLRLNERLIRAAEPIMRMIEISTRSTNSITLLTSADSILLAVVGDNGGLSEEEKDLNKPGCLCGIEKMGGRAISMCLLEKQPLSLCGPEHYCRYFHTSSCYAAPIYGQNNVIVGSIGVSGWTSDWHPHTLALVTSAADAISSRLRESQLFHSQQRLNAMLSSVYDSLPEVILALDSEGCVTHANTNAATLLKTTKEALQGQPLTALLHDDCKNTIAGLIKKGKTASCNIHFVNSGSDQVNLCRLQPTGLAPQEHAGITLSITTRSQLLNLAAHVGGNYAVYDFHHIKGESAGLQSCVELARKVAGTSSRILLTGESGTGKEFFGQAIHNNSRVKNGPFVAISCAAIPRELIEAELFGYVGGAFTGARSKGALGKFELASGGTLFLDEINSLPLDMQTKLLRVLQQGEIMRIGDSKPIVVKTRIIAATNRDLKQAVQENTFREDLYYRLNVVEIKIPPLRERKGDITILAKYILHKIRDEAHLPQVAVDKSFFAHLNTYSWPGNVRELYNVCERALVLAGNDTLQPSHLPEFICASALHDEASRPTGTLEEQFFKLLDQNLIIHKHNMSRVAQSLGISRSTLYRKMKNRP